jgi:glutamate-1-semialdehyde 2,1-aminomutase
VLEDEHPYDRLFSLGQRLMEGLKAAAVETKQPLLVQGLGPMFHTGFTNLTEVKDYRDTLGYDKAQLNHFISALHDRDIRVIGRGLWYISTAHTEQDIDQAIDTARKVLAEM